MFASFKRIIKWGFQGFFRNSGASLAAMLVMIVAISIITALFLLQRVTDFSINSIEKQVALSVYFKDGTGEDEILTAKRELEKLNSVKKIEYISKDKALDIFKKRHKKDILVQDSLATIAQNPFLSYLSVKASKPALYKNLADFLNKKALFKDSIDHINYTQISPIIDRISKISAGLANFGLILAIVSGIIVFLVTFNTIKLAIYNLKDEIFVMRLVGASNFFIKGPLIVQGVISGILASVLTLAIFSVFLYIFSPNLNTFMPGLNLFSYFNSNIVEIFLLQLAAAIGLGVVSSSIAMKKYLRL